MVNSMSILCLRNILLTLDWDGIMPYGAYPLKLEFKCCKRFQDIFFNPTNFAEVITILEPARST